MPAIDRPALAPETVTVWNWWRGVWAPGDGRCSGLARTGLGGETKGNYVVCMSHSVGAPPHLAPR